ncbi:MAG: RrF2 family transcriptional regulator [bacterium]
MRISTRSRYGLRAMVELSRAYGKGPVTARAISDSEGISISYLEHLLARLRQAGLVESVRGPGGGFRLAKVPTDISLLSIISALDGPVILCDCFEKSAVKLPCQRLDACAAKSLWEALNDKIQEALETTTLGHVS